MNPAIASILNMVVGNPLTGVPGALLFATQFGPVLTALGAALTSIGSGTSLWDALLTLQQDPHIIGFESGIGLMVAKDHNVTGGAKRNA